MGGMDPRMGSMDPRISGMPPGGMMGDPRAMGGMGGPPGGMMGDPRMDNPRFGGMGGMGMTDRPDPRHFGMLDPTMPSMPLHMPEQPPDYNPMPPPPPHHQRRPRSPASSISSHRSEDPPRCHRPGTHERIPMGAYAVPLSPKLTRSRTEPTTAQKLNRGQSSNRPIGPSGKEWIQGDAFLDACRCTTGCTCRGGHRVLYRSRDDAGSESDGSPRYQSGEIRYILKSDLGKDCGDHSNCVPKKAGSSSSSSASSTTTSKREKEDKKRKEEMRQLKNEMLEAVEAGIRKARSSKAGSVASPRVGFTGLDGGGGMGMMPNIGGVMGGMDTNMAHMGGGPTGMPLPGIGMTSTGFPPGVNPYSIPMPMPKLPPGMQDPRTLRPFFDTTPEIDPYFAKDAHQRFRSPPGAHIDPRAFYGPNPARGRGRGGLRRPLRREDYGSDDLDVLQRRGQSQRQDECEDGFGKSLLASTSHVSVADFCC